jgi:hypothetical protein
MSTKTISKRVALATVVALGAGVLSLVSVSSASATNAAANANIAPAINASNVAATVGTLNIASNLIAASAQTNDAAGTGATASATVASNKSSGLLAVSDIAGNKVAGTTQTATLVSNGAIAVYTALNAVATSNNVNDIAVITVTGGTLSQATSTATNSYVAYNSGATAVALESTAATPIGAVLVKPNAGVSSMTISMYSGSAFDSSSTWGKDGHASNTAVLAASAAPTTGTLTGQILVSVAANSLSGTLSLTNSKIVYNSTTTGSETEATTSGIGTSDYATVQYSEIILKDAYGVVISTPGILQASASNGAYVALGSSGSANSPASAGSSSNAFVTTAGSDVGLTVGAGALSTGGSTIVTVSFNGTVIGTKSFTFTGKVAKVTLSAAGAGYTGNNARGNKVTIAFTDAAGNSITFPTATTGNGAYPYNLTKDPNSFKGFGIGLNSVVQMPTSTTAGYFLYTCTQNMTDSVVVNYSNADGSVVASNAVNVSCSGVADTYTAKLDKTTYHPGDVATLTVSFKDTKGQPAADIAAGTSPSGIVDGTTAPTIAGFGTAVNTPSNADYTTNSVKTYQFIVGSATGSFTGSVSFPYVNSNMDGVNQTVSYSVTDGSTSLNDVLKGIVSLIASINKQIAALAKLVTKK